MKIISRALCFFVLLLTSNSIVFGKTTNEYLILVSRSVNCSVGFDQVVEHLKNKHNASTIFFSEHPNEVLDTLKKLQPRYIAVVDIPDNIDMEYVVKLNRMTRSIDDDIYQDCIYGIITGYDYKAILRNLNNSTNPYLVKYALNTTSEASSSSVFMKNFWLNDGKDLLCGERDKDPSIQKKTKLDFYEILPKFVDLYTNNSPDVLITSAHATEELLEMPSSSGNIKCVNGRLFADFGDTLFLPEYNNPRVYFAAGNCLIGNIHKSKESMAVAWLSGGGATSMVGYTVATWYGKAGWGTLKYWLSNPNSITLAQAYYLNTNDMIYSLNNLNEKLSIINPTPYKERYKDMVVYELKQAGLKKPSKDEIGILHDRDVLAFYGDPKWDVKVYSEQHQPYKVKMVKSGNIYLLTITTNKDYKEIISKRNDLKNTIVPKIPFVYFFKERIHHPEIINKDQFQKTFIDENSLMLFGDELENSKTYTIKIKSNIKQ